MPPKKKRLTTEAFSRFFASGRRFHSDHLQLIHTPNPVFHGAAVVGKKVYKTAVKRNRLRRQLYSALYAWHRAGDHNGVYIVVAKPAAANISGRILSAELRELVGRTHE
ncbi:MAG: ribonuclease P protein component [Candidatus Paceibacterota bacterium]